MSNKLYRLCKDESIIIYEAYVINKGIIVAEYCHYKGYHTSICRYVECMYRLHPEYKRSECSQKSSIAELTRDKLRYPNCSKLIGRQKNGTNKYGYLCFDNMISLFKVLFLKRNIRKL